MAVKRALNLVTIRDAPLPRKLDVARGARYDGVGLWVNELDGNPGGAEAVAQLLAQHGLSAAELCFVGGWMYAEQGLQGHSRERAEHAFRLAQALKCGCVVACASGASGDLADAARDFAALCDLAREFDGRVALEFLGGAEQVKDVRTAWQIVDMVDAPNGGLLIDTFHFYKGGSQLADLDPIAGDRVFLVHVNDCLDIPREELEDRHRVFPGEGIIPLEPIAAALLDKGYAGFFSLELFNEDYWAADPYLVAQEGMRSMQRAGL